MKVEVYLEKFLNRICEDVIVNTVHNWHILIQNNHKREIVYHTNIFKANAPTTKNSNRLK